MDKQTENQQLQPTSVCVPHPHKSDFPFDELPPEMKSELLSYLDRKSLLNFRLVSKECNLAVFQLKPIQFDACTLSDETYQHVLKSKETVSCIRIENLESGNAKNTIISELVSGSVLETAAELKIGSKIHPETLEKILEECGEGIRSLTFQSPDQIVINCFLSSRVNFQLLTELQLYMNLAESINDKDEQFLKKLSTIHRFPCLKSFHVDWRGPQLYRGVLRDLRFGRANQPELLHSMYVSVHQLLYNHKDTVESIIWDFSGLIVTHYGGSIFNDDMEYWSLRPKMNEIFLKNIKIAVAEMEGADYWDLSNSILLNQNNLINLDYTGSIIQSSSVDNTFGPLPTVLEQNKSLREVTLNNRVFAFFWLEGCNLLEKLSLTGSNISSLQMYRMPQGITHLFLDIKYVFPQDVRNLTSWMIEHLHEIRDVSFKLRLMWCNVSSFPALEEFPSLFLPPKLERLVLEYEASTASGIYLVALQANRLQRICESRKFRGVTMLRFVTESAGLTKYQLVFKINPNVFKRSCLFV